MYIYMYISIFMLVPLVLLISHKNAVCNAYFP